MPDTINNYTPAEWLAEVTELASAITPHDVTTCGHSHALFLAMPNPELARCAECAERVERICDYCGHAMPDDEPSGTVPVPTAAGSLFTGLMLLVTLCEPCTAEVAA